VSPEILEAEVELPPHVLEDGARDRDSPGSGDSLEPGGDVHAVAVDPVAFDKHVADMNADAKLHAPINGPGAVFRRERSLDFDGAAHGVHGTRKLGEKIVARRIDDAPAMPEDFFADPRAMAAESRDRPLFVLRHQATVADYVG
jgi:hypothetical protein